MQALKPPRRLANPRFGRFPWNSSGATKASLGCATALPTARSHFRHFSPEVPDSPHIGAYPCIFHFLQPLQNHQKSAATKHVLATLRSLTNLDRTQKVGGSKTPRSIQQNPPRRKIGSRRACTETQIRSGAA